MAFAAHWRVTMLGEYRNGSSGAALEYAQPGFSFQLAAPTQGEITGIAAAIQQQWGTPALTIPSNCFLVGIKFSNILPTGKVNGDPVIVGNAPISGGGQNDKPTFQALCATLESSTPGKLTRRRGRIFFPSGATMFNGKLATATRDNFATQVASLLSDANAAIEGSGGFVVTASRTDGTNHRVTSVTADDVPDYMSSRKRQLLNARSASLPVN